MIVKYGERKQTEEDRKHPEFDDPFIEIEYQRPSSQMDKKSSDDSPAKDYNNSSSLRMKSEVSFLTHSESKVAIMNPKLSQESTQNVMNFMLGIIDGHLHKEHELLDSSYSYPLMDQLFGYEEQQFLNQI
jgi:hypothetical protein